VIACAVAAQAETIVSGDADLLVLGHHGDIRIINASSVAAEIAARTVGRNEAPGTRPGGKTGCPNLPSAA